MPLRRFTPQVYRRRPMVVEALQWSGHARDTDGLDTLGVHYELAAGDRLTVGTDAGPSACPPGWYVVVAERNSRRSVTISSAEVFEAAFESTARAVARS